MTFPSDFLDSTGSPHQQHGAHQGFDAQQGHGLGANGCVKYVCLHMYVYICMYMCIYLYKYLPERVVEGMCM